MDHDAASARPQDTTIIENLAFSTDAGLGERARIGLVVLATDYTVEHEFRRLTALPGVDFYVSRIQNANSITPETLAAMGPRITDSVDLILPGSNLDVVAFGCTSASMVLGSDAVGEHIRAARPHAKPTNPASAAFAAFKALGARRIAVLTPYRRDVNLFVRDVVERHGFHVPVFGSFNEEQDPIVAAIDRESLTNAVRTIASDQDFDAVFVSCTSVRLVDAVADLEAEIGRPVTSSNLALAWHCLRLAGIPDHQTGFGRLFELDLAE